ncbi:hypothetical protein ACHAPD_008956 [Fusarium lateritium]
MKVLCVAEKPSISKAVATHLAGGRVETHNTRSKYIKNYSFDFDFGQQLGHCSVNMTCVTGHLTNVDFTPANKSWYSPPPESLFTAPIVTTISDDKKVIAQNLESQARYAQVLVIWTDCDREGEHIGNEIVEAARKGKPGIRVLRARFSNIERAHVISAARNLTTLDERQVNAVATRIELDLRIGYAFTRFLTNNLRQLGGPLEKMTLSYATVIKVQQKPTRKFKPLPLTTVELQKAATRLLHMSGQQAMTIAEGLYNKGFISYPRTETDRFDRGMNLRTLVDKQTTDQRWGPFAQNLVNGVFQQPREGRNDDKAHPPIHPITYASPTVLNRDEGRLYEYIVRRFLACCSDDAKGMASDVEVEYGDERFNAHGVIVLERNYLDVFVYEKWNNTVELPKFTEGERFQPTEAMMTEGKTSAPGFLTEADLIALMDANGIGTDATMAEHIQKIQDREYAATIGRSGEAPRGDEESDTGPSTRGRGRGRGGRGSRGGRGGRGGASTSGGRGGVKVFVPTQLGVALILGFDRMNFETSLGKPFLRKEMEIKMKAICDGRANKEAVLRESLAQYRRVFDQSQEQLGVLRTACREFVFTS